MPHVHRLLEAVTRLRYVLVALLMLFSAVITAGALTPSTVPAAAASVTTTTTTITAVDLQRVEAEVKVRSMAAAQAERERLERIRLAKIKAAKERAERIRLAKLRAARLAAARLAEQRRLARIKAAQRREATRQTSVSTVTVSGSGIRARAVRYALAQRGKWYCWGGDGPSCYDCSGLVMAAYRSVGVALPHSSGALYGVTYGVSRSNAIPGDIAWRSGHVGLYIGGGKMVVARHSGTRITIQDVPSTMQLRRVRL